MLSGRIAEGETIDLAALSDELDLSLTAIREAIKVLAAKGLVGSRQRKGPSCGRARTGTCSTPTWSGGR
ncbi:GntR family transcriptional regulator [Nocardiopsis sp. ARC36]